MDMFNRAFAEVMMEGDMSGSGVLPGQFLPIILTKDFDWESKMMDPIWEMTAKYGIPYFSNFINSDMILTMLGLCVVGLESITEN
jgi:ribonucleoside-triphosphate reductase